MKFQEGDRVLIKADYREYKVHTGVVTQRWRSYDSKDKEPTYNVLMDLPEDRSAQFSESQLERDVLGELNHQSETFRIGDRVRIKQPHMDPLDIGTIKLIANGRADVKTRNGTFWWELGDLELVS